MYVTVSGSLLCRDVQLRHVSAKVYKVLKEMASSEGVVEDAVCLCRLLKRYFFNSRVQVRLEQGSFARILVKNPGCSCAQDSTVQPNRQDYLNYMI